MPVNFWWPTSMPAQLVVVQNFGAKIASYATVLAMSPAQVASAQALCTQFASAFNATEQCRQTMVAMTAWRDKVFNGQPSGQTAPPPPAFPVQESVDYSLGIVNQLFALRDLIVASPGYTQTIGEDLGLVGTQKTNKPESNVFPNLKTTTSAGYQVNITGSMQGMDALRVEYAPKGGAFAPVAFLTNTPGGFQVTPAKPGEPETGQIRAVFIRKNEAYGNYSANYPVTVS